MIRRPSNRRARGRVSEYQISGPGIQSVGDLILQLEALTNSSSTNRYVSRASIVAESIRKFQGIAIKGNLLTKNILNTRAAFTAGRGLLYKGDPKSDEGKFAAEFFRRNKFDLAYFRNLTRERCFEGQALLTLNPSGDGVPLVRFLSWMDTAYEVTADARDYGAIAGARYRAGSLDVTIPLRRMAFFKFDCRMNALEGTPLLSGVLNSLEDLDDALATWRTLNTKFSKPTPYWKFLDENDAKAFQASLAAMNGGAGWQWGDALAGAGEGTILQMGYGPYTSIENEVTFRAKLISGHTGVPVQYMGFADLLTSKATADDLRDAVVLVSEVEQKEWESGMSDLLGRAMSLYNSAKGAHLDVAKSEVQIELINDVQFKRVKEIWLPLFEKGAITLETLLEKVPEIDEHAEAPRVKRLMLTDIKREAA